MNVPQHLKMLYKKNMTFELVLPNQHRKNAAERAIRTFKTHLLSGLATCRQDFPLCEWYRLLHQVELTLNLFRYFRMNLKLSAWAYVFGNHDSNKCPLLPPVTKISIHANPGKRASWSFHGEQGRYIGSAIDCYRLITCYIPKTHKERIIDTAKIIPNNILIPQASLNYHLRRTADDLIHLPHQNKTQLTPDTPLTTKSALLDIAKIL